MVLCRYRDSRSRTGLKTIKATHTPQSKMVHLTHKAGEDSSRSGNDNSKAAGQLACQPLSKWPSA